MQKTGNSPFYFEKLSIEAEENVFLPVGAIIKQLRRAAVKQVRKQFVAQFWREDTVISEDINNREKDDQKGHAVSE